MPLLNERYYVGVLVHFDHKHLLIGILCLVRMINDVQNVTVLNMHDSLFKRNPTFLFQNLVLLVIPLVRNHALIVVQRVPYGNIFSFDRTPVLRSGVLCYAYLAEVPELPGCMADGQTYREALEKAEVIIREWIETAKELGRPIPSPRGRLKYA